VRLVCSITRSLLAFRPDTRPLPAFLRAHVTRCESCRREEAAFRRLRETLARDGGQVGECPVEWNSVTVRLQRAAPRRPRVSPALAATAVLALLVLAANVSDHARLARLGAISGAGTAGMRGAPSLLKHHQDLAALLAMQHSGSDSLPFAAEGGSSL